jgi:hypothetical protein
MSGLKRGLVLMAAVSLTACGTPQKVIHPVSNPELTQLRGKIDYMIDTYRMRNFTMGSYLFPTEGTLFQKVPVTDARNAIVYIYRPHSSWNEEEVVAPIIFLNGRRLHGIRDSSYYWMELPAGQYDFALRRPIGPVYLTHIFKTKLRVEGGRSYYFRYDEENYRPQPDASLGLFKERYLTELPESMALNEIRETRLDKPGYAFATATQSRWKPFDLYEDGDHPVPKQRLEADTDLQIQKPVLMWDPLSW